MKVYSRLKPEKLLHLVNRLNQITKRTDLCPDEEFMQCATLKLEKNKTFQAHKHIEKTRTFNNHIAQESWVVIKGSVEVYFYDLDDSLIETYILNPGDASFTFYGGHNYRILEEDTIIYEYKTGPYEGQKIDKVFI
tara:strand:+ start:7003 stop:7410 length:408 start_codon:yes stop_codon:yes gene_type:complete